MTEAEQLDTQFKGMAAEQDNLEDYDEWVMLYSEADEANYFYNQWTGESQFEVPEAWAEQQAAPGYCKESLALSMSPLLSACLRLQATYRAKRARRQARRERARIHLRAQGGAPNGQVWVSVMDPLPPHKPYYWNKVTDEVRWEPPMEEGAMFEPAGYSEDYPEWAECFDPELNVPYYYNNYTGETKITISAHI